MAQKKKKILFFTPVAAYTIHVGVLLDEMVKCVNEGHEVIYVYNNCCYDFCSANMTADTARCKLCKFDMYHMLKLVPKGVQCVNLNSYWSSKTTMQFQYANVHELKKIVYKGVQVGYSILSTYINATRSIAPIIDANTKEYFDALCLRSVKLTDAFEKVLDAYKPNRVCFYNVRLLEQRPEYDLARTRNIETYSYEVYGGWNEPFYKRTFINNTPHNVAHLYERYRTLWDSVSLAAAQKKEIGESFFRKKRNGIAAGDKVYTTHQQKGKLPPDWHDYKEHVVIFNSSEDEFSDLGDEFERLALFRSQYQGIRSVADALKDKANTHVWLRIHPNLKDIPYRYHTELYKLSQAYHNLTVISGDADISSYDMMDVADKVVVFGSTIGLESAYHKKPVILLAGSIYYYSDICYVPHSREELVELLNKEILPPKDNKEAIKVGFYRNYRNPKDLYENVDFNKESIKFLNRTWDNVYHYLKILGSYKLYAIVKHLLYKFFFKKNRKSIDIPLAEDLNLEL